MSSSKSSTNNPPSMYDTSTSTTHTMEEMVVAQQQSTRQRAVSPIRSVRESQQLQEIPDSPRQRTRELARRIEERRNKRRELLQSQQQHRHQYQSQTTPGRGSVGVSSHPQEDKSVYSRQTEKSYYSATSGGGTSNYSGAQQRHFHSPRTNASATSSSRFQPRYRSGYSAAERQHLSMPMDDEDDRPVSDFVPSRSQQEQYSAIFDSKPWRNKHTNTPSSSSLQRPRSQSPMSRKSKTEDDNTTAVHSFHSRYLEAAKVATSPARPSYPSEEGPTPSLPAAHSQDSMSWLVARLNAIDRQDPAQALQQIDQILQNEALNAQQQLQNQPQYQDHDDDEDDGSSVSSITNPTFQERPLQNSVYSYGQPAVRSRSKLENYSSTTRTIDRSKPKKIRAPPPTVIDTKKKKDSMEEPPTMTETGYEKQEAPEMQIQKVEDVQSPLNGPHRKDILSRESEDLGSIVTPKGPTASLQIEPTPIPQVSSPVVSPNSRHSRKSVSPSRRRHPWDDELAAVGQSPINTRETSMESAFGVETEYIPRKALDQPQKHKQQNTNSREQPSSLNRDKWIAAAEATANAGRQASANTSSSRNLQNQTKAMSEDFDSAWVSVPPSSFFSSKTKEPSAWDEFRRSPSEKRVIERETTTQKIPSKAYVEKMNEMRPEGAVQTFTATTLKNGSSEATEESSARSGSMASFSEPNRYVRSPHRKAQSEVGTPSSSRTGRFGLRGLLSRRKVQLEDEDIEKRNAEKARFRSRRNASASPSRMRSRSLEEKERVSRIRNPNIAKKFSSMLKVYDDEQRGPKGYI